MKDRVSHKVLKGKLFILLFSIIVIIGFSYKTNAQGWTFTFQLAESGPCGGGTLPVLPTFPNFGFPTQNQCESMRQTILNISASMAMYDNQGHYIGECKVYYTCTPCSGSDIVTPGQVNPGDVSFDAQSQGKPFFTPHQSEAFEDWARDYKQLLESYGITSILGNQLSGWLIPLTGDKNFDKFYNSQSDNFNPPPAAIVPGNPPNQDASVVDLSGKTGVVKLLTTADEQKKRDEWYQEHLQDQGYNDLSQISSNDGITDQPEGNTWDLQKTQHLLFVGAGIAATAAILLAAAPEVATVGIVAALGEEVGAATVVSWSLPVIEESVKAIEDCASGDCPTTTQILTNMGVGEISNVVGTSGEILSGYASVATQQAIGTISTHGVNIVKYVWNTSFGAADATVQTWGAVNADTKK